MEIDEDQVSVRAEMNPHVVHQRREDQGKQREKKKTWEKISKVRATGKYGFEDDQEIISVYSPNEHTLTLSLELLSNMSK